MNVTILGNNSALPAYGRHPTAQVVSVAGTQILLDCGEGAQIQMQRFGVKWRKLEYIFISHLHGDHYFGLPGLINSMSLLGRTLPLHLFAPPGLEAMLEQIFQAADTRLNYPFSFHPLHEGTSDFVVDNDLLSVKTFPVEHRIPCHGFLIEEKTKGRKLQPEKCREYEIPSYFYHRLKLGENYERADGFVVENKWVTSDGPPSKKYAYCADTVFTQSFVEHIRGANTIYHESTYLENDAERAASRFHSTAMQAAQIASLVGAEKLLLGHFSSKYKDLTPFREEAASVFPNSIVTEEGTVYEI